MAKTRIIKLDGQRLVHGPMDNLFLYITLILVLIGLFFVFSASFPNDVLKTNGENAMGTFTHQLIFAVIGLIVLIITAMFSLPTLITISFWFNCTFGWFLLLVPRFITGAVNGSYCWIRVGPFSFQPSELVKVTYVLMLASLLARPVGKDWNEVKLVFRTLIAMAVFCLILIFIQEDLGMAIVVVAITLTMLFLRGINGFIIGGIAGLGFIGGWIFAQTSEARMLRISSFIQPWEHKGGEHACQMLATIARYGIFGAGIGQCTDKWGALTYPETDAIFCVIASEIGLIGAAAVILLFIAYALKAMKIGEASGIPSGWYIASSIGLLIVIQALMNIAVATSSLPCTGLTLPYISAGGSSLIASMLAAGIILNVSRYKPVPGPE